ncbi:PP2C family protein-serine/threonine phosphatase [Saccharothrix longispora]|uniref:PP2C family protein-serine/threonine phosphatase n=1 Tax=Saccharothrix longispora TaxID=33920 RepID=UPI0028FD844A|nr:PP2C family protein-serine/threonine phosphatase [Saccharothrix longispora]MBY8848981.1 serine/threonine-protein phosphatase [Saccharothrix sp. MB29]MDU0289750.1 PP2C family protein-serine/threonine phosphatase [Saccharothrix longispora]
MLSDRHDHQRQALARAVRRAEMPLEDLWMRYFSLGGDIGITEVEAYLNGLMGLPAVERDVLAHVVNERLDELARVNQVPYSREVRDPEPRSRPLAALVALLHAAETASPDRVDALADAAGRVLGVVITVHLVDRGQRRLRGPADGGPALDVRTTPAGRAYRTGRPVPSRGESGPRLWVPLVDGVARLGVLEVACGEEDLDDPGLRTQCGWVSRLLGRIVVALDRSGDTAADRADGAHPVTAELVRSLLPPLSGASGEFRVSALHEPSGHGGDAFDYALSETSACLAVLTADGPQPGLAVATALAAHRRARRAGHDPVGQAGAVDEALGAHFGPDTSVTGVLADLDLRTGRLCFVNAGHPEPLVLRAGRTALPLPGGTRPPLGKPGGRPVVGESLLARRDWLLLRTEGVTDGDDARGLADLLRAEAAAATTPPETTLRLLDALRAEAVPGRDATLLLARWTGPTR